MYKFDQIEVASKKFNGDYQVIDTVDLEKIRVSEGVVANKHDTRYTIGYEVNPGKIVPFYIKTPKDCASSGVSKVNESSQWKMGFNMSEDEEWVKQYKSIWIKIKEVIFQKLTGEPLSNDKYVNPKLITWDGEIRTRPRGISWNKPDNIGACYAIGVLKIGSVYRQGTNISAGLFEGV